MYFLKDIISIIALAFSCLNGINKDVSQCSHALTLFAFWVRTMYPHRINGHKNTEKRKESFFKSTNLKCTMYLLQ